jgi:hypothetical protein
LINNKDPKNKTSHPDPANFNTDSPDQDPQALKQRKSNLNLFFNVELTRGVLSQASYLAHTQGKKHQSNLARRAAKEAKEAPVQPAPAKVHICKFLKFFSFIEDRNSYVIHFHG